MNKEIINLKNKLIETINGANLPAIVVMYVLQDISGQLGQLVEAELKSEGQPKEEEGNNELQHS